MAIDSMSWDSRLGPPRPDWKRVEASAAFKAALDRTHKEAEWEHHEEWKAKQAKVGYTSGPLGRELPTADQTQKADGGKSDPLLLEVDLARALAVVNAVLDYGKQKYGARGGWKAVDIMRYDSAARRHRRARDTGETVDAESGLLHLAHEACNVLFQLEQHITANKRYDFTIFKTPTPIVQGET